MNTLTTQTYFDHGKVHIHWAAGMKAYQAIRSGVLVMEGSALNHLETKIQLASGELQAIWHLLHTKGILGENRGSDSIQLCLSQTAAINLLQQQEPHSWLFNQYQGLCVHLLGATLIADQAAQAIELKDPMPEKITFSAIQADCYCPSLGKKVKITSHALLRFAQRSGSKSISKALKTLKRYLSERPLHRVNLPKEVEQRKLKKYAQVGHHYSLSYINGIRGILLPSPEDQSLTLITVYDVSAYYLD